MMLSSSFTFGIRQSVWPAKFVLLSVATCWAKAFAQGYVVLTSWTEPSMLSFSHTSPVLLSVTFPLVSQQVICPVAGKQDKSPRTPRTKLTSLLSTPCTLPSSKPTIHANVGPGGSPGRAWPATEVDDQ